MGKIFGLIHTMVDDWESMSEEQRIRVLVRRGFRVGTLGGTPRDLDVLRVHSLTHSVAQRARSTSGWIRALSFEEYIRALNELPPIEGRYPEAKTDAVSHRVDTDNGGYYIFRVVYADGVPHWALDGTILARKVEKNAEQHGTV